MAEFTPAKKLATDFNGGQEYKNEDAVMPEDWNNLIESALYTQEQADSVVSLATNQPDTSSANNVGTPTVTIEDTANGKQFKFSNLKGKTPNVSATATVGNTVGTPSVTVTKTDNGENTVFNFDFENIKGATGATGASSINSALVENVDGNSEVNTFSQKFIKGEAQAKNYYNQAVYDSSVSNGDGTANVERNTKFYGNISDDLYKKGYFRQTSNGTYEFGNDSGVHNEPVIGDYVSTILLPQTGGELYNGAEGIAFSSGGGCWICVTGLTTAEQYKTWLLQNKILIQYHLPTEYQYTEQVIENNPIRPANQKEEWYWHEEWEKGLNLIDRKGSATQGTIYIGKPIKKAGMYTIQTIVDSTNGNISVDVFNSQGGFVRNIASDSSVPTTFTWSDEDISSGRLLNIYCASTTGTYKVMLVEGAHPYPYAPYNGKLLHEIDLSKVQLFPADVNPAQTIGGDWTDEGTVTTSTGTILHAYRRL